MKELRAGQGRDAKDDQPTAAAIGFHLGGMVIFKAATSYGGIAVNVGAAAIGIGGIIAERGCVGRESARDVDAAAAGCGGGVVLDQGIRHYKGAIGIDAAADRGGHYL